MSKKQQAKAPEYGTVLKGVEIMQPAVDMLKKELLAMKKATHEGKPKRVSYHTRRVINCLYNLHTYFWHPMFQWAQQEDFWRRYEGVLKRRKKRRKRNGKK